MNRFIEFDEDCAARCDCGVLLVQTGPDSAVCPKCDATESPSDDWKEDCMHWWGEVLTGNKAHWCPDWDNLPIDDTRDEINFCHCAWAESPSDEVTEHQEGCQCCSCMDDDTWLETVFPSDEVTEWLSD